MRKVPMRTGRAGTMVLALVCLAVIAACAPTAPVEPAAVTPAPAAATASIPPPRPAHKPKPVVAALPDPTPVPASVTPVPADTEAAAAATEATPPPPSGTFERLQGLDQQDTLAILGEPLQRSDSPPALLWRYVSRDCELQVYFYLDLESREMRVLHYEITSHDGIERPGQSCYGELVTERESRNGSARADSVGIQPDGSADRPR
jgi:hypothetical protein